MKETAAIKLHEKCINILQLHIQAQNELQLCKERLGKIEKAGPKAGSIYPFWKKEDEIADIEHWSKVSERIKKYYFNTLNRLTALYA